MLAGIQSFLYPRHVLLCSFLCSVLNRLRPPQIISMQTLHYLTLSILVPPLLSIFAEPDALIFEGGATNVGALHNRRVISKS